MKSGIYKIYNTISDKSYIGSSEKLNRRLKDHKIYLKNNVHPSTHLQNSYNKYGIKAFEYSIIEYCPIDKLEEREDYWLSIIPKEKRYNQRVISKSNRGMKWSEETKMKLKGRKPWNNGLAGKGICKATSGCIKKGERVSIGTEFKKGHNTWNKGTKGMGVCKPNKASFATTTIFSLVSPENILYEGSGIVGFSRELGLNYIPLSLVSRNKKESYKGWRLPQKGDVYNGIGLWLDAV